MSVSTGSPGLDKLGTAEKVAPIDELRADIVTDERAHPISDEPAADPDRRIASFEANPEDVHTLREVMETPRKDRGE